jgi:hypothetical protein
MMDLWQLSLFHMVHIIPPNRLPSLKFSYEAKNIIQKKAQNRIQSCLQTQVFGDYPVRMEFWLGTGQFLASSRRSVELQPCYSFTRSKAKMAAGFVSPRNKVILNSLLSADKEYTYLAGRSVSSNLSHSITTKVLPCQEAEMLCSVTGGM